MATVLTPAEIKQKITDWITTNGNHEITGAHLNTILAAIMDYVGVGYALRGTAPASAPSPDVPSAYLAGPGTYTNYESGDTVIPEGSIAILKYDGSAWSKSVIKVCDPVSVSQNTLSIGGEKVIYGIDSTILSRDLSQKLNAMIEGGEVSLYLEGLNAPAFKIESGVVSQLISDNWCGIIVRADILKNVVTCATVNGISIIAPAIMYFKENPIDNPNSYISSQFGTTATDNPSFTKFNGQSVVIPSGANWAVINMYKGASNDIIGSCRVEIQSDSLIDKVKNIDSALGLQDIALKNVTGAAYQILDGEIVAVESANWKGYTTTIENIAKIITCATATNAAADVPAIMYFSGAPSTATFLGKQYGSTPTNNASFNIFNNEPLNVPNGCTHIIVNVYVNTSINTILDDCVLEKNSIEPQIQSVLNRTLVTKPYAQLTQAEKDYFTQIVPNLTADKELTIGVGSEIHVKKDGSGDYTTVSAAVAAAQGGDVIIVHPGVYVEDIHVLEKSIYVKGVDRDACIITNSTGLRATPPIECKSGTWENLTIYADSDTVTEDDEVAKAYGVHVDESTGATYRKIIFRNCKIGSKLAPAIGIGVRYNQCVILENCELFSKASKVWTLAGVFTDLGALYFHNDNEESNKSGAQIFVKDCLISSINNVMAMSSTARNNHLDATFLNNTLLSKNKGIAPDIVNVRTTPSAGMLCGDDIMLSPLSRGNNQDLLNYFK